SSQRRTLPRLRSAGASPAVFGASPKTSGLVRHLTPDFALLRLSREARDAAGEAPALPNRLANHLSSRSLAQCGNERFAETPSAVCINTRNGLKSSVAFASAGMAQPIR